MLNENESVKGYIGGESAPQCDDLHPDAIAEMMPKPLGTIWNSWDILACYDSEFQGENDGTNTILSWQMAALVNQGDNDWCYAENYEDRDKRPTLAELVGKTLDICRWPKNQPCRLLLVSHFTVAEWSMLADRNDWVPYLMEIGGTLVSNPRKDISVAAVRRNHNQTETSVCIRDTMLLTPGRGGLKKASQMTPFAKLEIGTAIGSMRQYRQDEPERFTLYALQDVRAGLAFIVGVGNKIELLTGKPKLSLTLGGMATQGFVEWLEGQDGYGLRLYHGHVDMLMTDKFNRQKIMPVKSMPRQIADRIGASCFHGGRNYSAYFGRGFCAPGHYVLDLDLSGAYAAAMATMPLIDWSIAPTQITDLAIALQFIAGREMALLPVAMGEVAFEFSEGVEPCLPVASGAGLLYPRTGTSYCTGIELWLAAKKGAQLTLKNFFVWKAKLTADFEPIPAFSGYMSRLARRRQEHKKGTVENTFFKEMGNSLYGKLAQGVTERTILNLVGERQNLPPSRVTNVLYAAAVTGIVRAVLQCLEDGLDNHGGKLLAATTDGAMAIMPCATTIDADEVLDIERLVPGLQATLHDVWPVRVIQQGRLNLGLPVHDWLELKHFGNEYLVFKTRGYALRFGGMVTFTAKAGHKLDGTPEDIWNELTRLFEEETPSKLSFRRLVSVHDILSGKSQDLVSIDQTRTANTDWDWKRDLNPDGSTRAFSDIGQIFRHRVASQNIRANGQRATPDAVKLNLQGVKLHGGTEKTMRRFILRAIVHGVGGWAKPKAWTYPQLAGALKVSIDDIKNAKRFAFQPNSLPQGDLLTVVMKSMAKAIKKRLSVEMRMILEIPVSKMLSNDE